MNVARMLAYWIKKAGKRSKAIQTQLLCATIYGLLEFYGIRGTILVIMKARRKVNDAKQRAVSRVRERRSPE